MQITLVDEGITISTSNLLSATLRTDLVPVPISLEINVQNSDDLEGKLGIGTKLTIGDLGIDLTIIASQPFESQTIKDGRRVSGVACVAIPLGCESLITPLSKAVIQDSTSMNSAMRACGLRAKLGNDVPLPKFVCLRGTIPTERIALYAQQESAVIAYQNKKIGAFKITELLKQPEKITLDESAVAWIESDRLQSIRTASYVGVGADGSTYMGEDASTGRNIKQVAGADTRQLKNLGKILIVRGTVLRPLMPEINAGDTVKIGENRYVVITVAHRIDTGSLGGSSVTASKFWIGDLANV